MIIDPSNPLIKLIVRLKHNRTTDIACGRYTVCMLIADIANLTALSIGGLIICAAGVGILLFAASIIILFSLLTVILSISTILPWYSTDLYQLIDYVLLTTYTSIRIDEIIIVTAVVVSWIGLYELHYFGKIRFISETSFKILEKVGNALATDITPPKPKFLTQLFKSVMSDIKNKTCTLVTVNVQSNIALRYANNEPLTRTEFEIIKAQWRADPDSESLWEFTGASSHEHYREILMHYKLLKRKNNNDQ